MSVFLDTDIYSTNTPRVSRSVTVDVKKDHHRVRVVCARGVPVYFIVDNIFYTTEPPPYHVAHVITHYDVPSRRRSLAFISLHSTRRAERNPEHALRSR